MIAVAGGKAQYDDQLNCFAAYTDKGDFRAKTLDDLAALVPLTDAEREDLAGEKATSEDVPVTLDEVKALQMQKAALEGDVASLTALKAELKAGLRDDIINAVTEALKP